MFQKLTMHNKIFLTLSFCLMLPFAAQAASPLPSELMGAAGSPLEIKGDTADINTQEGTITYTGHVNVVQEKRQISGDQLIIYRNAEGEITKIVMSGSPVHYQGQLDGKPDIIHAYADKMEYDLKNELLYMYGDARIERDGDVYQAPEIQYDVANEIATSTVTPEGRTHIIIDPESLKNL